MQLLMGSSLDDMELLAQGPGAEAILIDSYQLGDSVDANMCKFLKQLK